MTDFFNLRGAAVFRVLSVISAIALGLTLLLFVIGLMLGFFGEQEAKAIGWVMVGFSISSFISCLFMYGFCYLIKVAKSYDKDEQEDNKEVTFQYKGYKGTFTKDDNTGRFDGHIIGTSYSYSGYSLSETELAFQARVDELLEEKKL
jgi:membrane protein implicated in regulation of membrane protease activity